MLIPNIYLGVIVELGLGQLFAGQRLPDQRLHLRRRATDQGVTLDFGSAGHSQRLKKRALIHFIQSKE